MDWLNIPRSSLSTEDFALASSVEVGVWLRLAVYCASQENGGRIQYCKKWNVIQWAKTAGVEKSEVTPKSPLWNWTDGGSLIVKHYPKGREAEVKAKRAGGKATARKRWGKKAQNKGEKNSSATSSANGSAHAEGEWNGMEPPPIREANALLATRTSSQDES